MQCIKLFSNHSWIQNVFQRDNIASATYLCTNRESSIASSLSGCLANKMDCLDKDLNL